MAKRFKAKFFRDNRLDPWSTKYQKRQTLHSTPRMQEANCAKIESQRINHMSLV